MFIQACIGYYTSDLTLPLIFPLKKKINYILIFRFDRHYSIAISD